MIFPLDVRQRFGQWMAFATISIRAPQYRIRPVILWVLVDTGSPWTAITPNDAFLLKIPIKALSKDDEFPTIQFAACKFWRLLMKNISVHIRDDARKVIAVNMPSTTVLEPMKTIPPEEFKGIPSVLGCDFLTINKLSLHFDPAKKVAFLEKRLEGE